MLGGLGRLLAKPEVQTGLGLGVVAAIRAYQPSLIDRSRNDQALIVAGSIASGYVAGNAFERVIGTMSDATGSGRGLPAGVIGTAAVVTRHLDLPPLVRTAAGVAGSTSLASAALALGRSRATGGATTALKVGVIGGAAAAALERQLHSYPDDGRPDPPLSDVATSLVTGAGVAAFTWSVFAAERAAARRSAAEAASRLGGPRLAWHAGAHAALLGAGALAAGVAARRFLGALEEAADLVEPGYADPPVSPLLSGGPHSALDHAALSVAGRRFVAEARDAATINKVMGIDAAMDPIRVYVGVDSAETIDARVGLAMAELKRCGAFDRSLLLAGSPSGSGYLNYIAVEAAEYLTGGDVATVTIQYGKLPSLLSIGRIDLAQRQNRALTDAIAGELARQSLAGRPRFVLYGESLGAQTSQDAFPDVAALTDRLVDRALWVGTPYPTRLRRSVLATNPSDRRFGYSAGIADHDAATAYTFLDHHEDPVTRFTPTIFYRRPPWLGPPADRPPNVSRTQRWVPAVTFWQTAFDTKNATEIVPGEFNAFGHDYRADLAEFVRAAYGLPEVTTGQMANVERALRRSEIERAAKNSAD